MTAIVLAAAAVLIIGVTAAVCYLAGRERGYQVGYQEGFGAGEMHRATEYGEVAR